MAGVPLQNKLHVSVSNGKLKDIKQLLNQDPNAVDLINEPAGVFGYTPIHEAVSGRRADILRVLLEYGGNVNVLSNGRYTPIQIAASIGDVECTKVLLDFDANLSLPDEFGKTPIVTAEVNRRKKVAKLLRTQEIKKLACNDNPELRAMLEGLQRGQDVEDSCFEDALKIAVNKNSRRAIGYLVLHGARNLEKCMQAALLKSHLRSTAALLLLCHASKINDNEMVKLLCAGRNRKKQMEVIDFTVPLLRKYLPAEWDLTVMKKQLRKLREAVCYSDMAFPVAVAFGFNNTEVAWTFLSEIYCKRTEEEADWHGLALNCLLPEWIEGIIQYKRLILSHNLLDFFPHAITKMPLLTRLDLFKNSIKRVPKELFEMKNLQNLNLSSNKIQYLPKVDEWSKSMKILNLKKNFLRFIDFSIAQSELEDLNVSDNKLSYVPTCICEIKTLQVLDLSQNQKITILPPDLAKLSQLNFLGIEKMDQITDPPPSLRAPTSVLLSYLRARLRNSEPFYTMKLMIVGLANRGKTTLMHRINRNFAFNKNNSTQGVDIREIRINRYTFKCWDFAGQEEYYATHQCFLSQRSLYLLVWNVEDGDDGIAGLKPWLGNLQFRVPRSSVIVVGTHLDKISASAKTESFEDDIIDKVFKLVSQYKEIFCQRDMIMLVTCSNAQEHVEECKRRCDRLRNLITIVAESVTVDGRRYSQKVMGEMVPSSYLTLARMIDDKRTELEEAGSIPLLRRCQFENWIDENATKHPRDYFDPEDIDVATLFLHNIGIILHYNDPNQDLRDLYFISPSWLCDLMAKVVTVKEAHSFIKDGMLFQRDIPFVIDDSRRFSKAFYQKYLRLLAKFQIACRVDSERVLVPSRLPLERPVESTSAYEPSQTLIRIHSFSCIPNGFWSRFISRFLLLLTEMLNVNHENSEQNSQNQTFDDNQNEDDVDADGSNEDRRELSSECFDESRDGVEAQCFKDAGLNTKHTSVDTSENKIGFHAFTPDSKIVNGIHSPDATDAREGDREGGDEAYLQDVNTEASTRSFDCTSPPFILNSCWFDNEDVSRYDDSSPSDSDPSSRDITPISFGGNSSLSSPFSTINQDHSRAPSSNTLDETDNSIPQTNFTSSKPQSAERTALPSRVLAGASDPVSQPVQNNNLNDNLEEVFDEPVDLPYLLSHRYLVCWRNGILFKHPQLYLSVSLLPPEDGRELVQTKVSCTVMGYRALAFIVDHIRTLIKEWFPGLDGTDGLNPYVTQLVPCPTCLVQGVNPPYHFDVADCLKESLTRDYMVCENSHTPQVVKLSDLCPDLLFMDLDSSLQLKVSDLRYDECETSLLGSGQYGRVYTGTYSGKAAAIKVYNCKLEENPDWHKALNSFYDIRQEAVVLSRIRHHPNVISFYGVAAKPRFCLVIELAKGGTLRTVLETQRIKRIVVYRIAQQISSAVAHLHSHGVIHRDLKSDNVLMFTLDSDSDVNIKLADFGTANFLDPVGLKYFTGAPGFVAPEILQYSKTEEYNEKVDVYSYAMVLYELISRRRPFQQARSALQISAMVKDGKRPAFYDLPDIKVRLLTLTQLMLKCWVQEATKRPRLSDINHQLKSSSFCLLYGKVPVTNVSTPRQLCFLGGTNEVWVSCDDRTGASVLVVDLATSTIKQKFVPENKSLLKAKETFFNFIGIHNVDRKHVAMILRSTVDYVSIYSKEGKKLVNSYQVLEHYIRSLTAYENYVVLGYDDGYFSIVSKNDFLKGNLDRLIVTVNKNCAISSIITDKCADEVDTKIILGCDMYIYKYPFSSPDFERVEPELIMYQRFVCEMHISEDGTILFVSHVASPIISIILINGMTQIGEIDCSCEVNMLIPNCNMNDQRVATFCVSSDTLWVGTGSGHILLYEITQDRSLSIITWLKPYKLEVQSLVPCNVTGMDPSRFVVSIGKEVSVTSFCYDGNGLCLLTSSLPVDPSDPELQQRESSNEKSGKTFTSSDEVYVQKMLLIWDAPEAATLKKLVQ